MSACTASPKVSQVFRGDSEDLLDHLLVACHAHKLRNQPLESFGRDLVPYFSPDEELAPLPTKNWQSCGSPPRSASSRGRKVVAVASSTSPSRATTVSRSSAKPRASIDLPAVKAPRNRTFGGSLCGSTASASPVSSAASLGTPQQLSSRSSFTSMGSSPPAACPAFFSSPKPEAIPMPTTGLLSSALLRAAECKAAPALHTARGFAIPTAAA